MRTGDRMMLSLWYSQTASSSSLSICAPVLQSGTTEIFFEIFAIFSPLEYMIEETSVSFKILLLGALFTIYGKMPACQTVTEISSHSIGTITEKRKKLGWKGGIRRRHSWAVPSEYSASRIVVVARVSSEQSNLPKINEFDILEYVLVEREELIRGVGTGHF